MAINQNPMFEWEKNLTPEQLAQMMSLVGGWKPGQAMPGDMQGEAGPLNQANVWSLPGDFGPQISWNPNMVTQGQGVDTAQVADPSGAGSFGINQMRNESTWGGSDTGGSWDQNGVWQGYGSGQTDARALAEFVGKSAGAYYAGGYDAAGNGADAATSAAWQSGHGLGQDTLTNMGLNAGGTVTQAFDPSTLGQIDWSQFDANTLNSSQLPPVDNSIGINNPVPGDGFPNDGYNAPNGNPGNGLQEPAVPPADPNSVTPATQPPPTQPPGNTTPPPARPWYQDPNVIRTGIGAGVTLATAGNSGTPGAAPGGTTPANPADVANNSNATALSNWQQQLNASRVNSVGPDGSSTWSQQNQFNKPAYDAAMAQWTAANNPNLPRPTEQQFTTQQWTNTQALSPEAQALKDAQRNVQTKAAQGLPWQADQYLNRVNAGVDRSGIPDYKYTAATQQQGMLGNQALPTYGQVSGPGAMSNPTFGDINRGAIQSTTDKTARDWASTVQGDVTDWNRQLANLDPWMFDQQGSEAMYNMSTRYMLPQQQAEKTALESRLGEQGFVPGTPAYDNALKQILDSQGLAQADARDRALLAGREYGNQAFDNKAGALQSASTGMLNFGELGLKTDAASFGQNMDLANLANAAQQQDFNQQNVLSQQQFAEGSAANQVVKDLFGMNLDATNTNNKWAGQDFTDLLNLTGTNNKAIGANNDIALQLAALNNSAVGQARGQANTDFLTDVGAQRNATLDLQNAMGTTPTAPGALTSQVPGMNQADISSMLQTYFNNNVDLQNASTAERNALIAALGPFLAAMLGG